MRKTKRVRLESVKPVLSPAAGYLLGGTGGTGGSGSNAHPDGDDEPPPDKK